MVRESCVLFSFRFDMFYFRSYGGFNPIVEQFMIDISNKRAAMEHDEAEIARIEGVPVIPLSELAKRFVELDPNQTIYIHCKMGGRSLKAVELLKQQGFKNCKSVAGGINAWSDEIDSSIPRY